MRTRLVLVAVAVSALLGTACGGEDAATPTQTSPAVSQGAGDATTDGTAWAGGVCTAADELQGSVDALGSSLQVDITGEGDALTQLREQLTGQAQAVREDASALAAAVADLPAGASDPDLLAARDDLEQSRDDLQGAVDDLSASIDALATATGAAELATGVAQVTTDFVAARAALTAFAASVQQVAEAGDEAVREAFDQAPACAGWVDPEPEPTSG